MLLTFWFLNKRCRTYAVLYLLWNIAKGLIYDRIWNRTKTIGIHCLWFLTCSGISCAWSPPVIRIRVVGTHLKMVAVLFHSPLTQYMPQDKWQLSQKYILASLSVIYWNHYILYLSINIINFNLTSMCKILTFIIRFTIPIKCVIIIIIMSFIG
jgi:hypothetical protein